MEMCYGGAMVLPRNYVVMGEEEMTYLDGGDVNDTYKTAYNASNLLGGLMAGFYAMAAGFTAATVITSATGIGLVVGGLGAGLYLSIAGKYKSAYISSQNIGANYGWGQRCRIREITFFGIITDVTCIKA